MPGIIGPIVPAKAPKPKPSGPRGVVADPRKGGIFDAANSTPPSHRPMNVAGLREHLRNVGYDIPAEGATIGPKMKAALADYLQVSNRNPLSPALARELKGTTITGRRDPKSWNQRFGSPKTRPVVQMATVDGAGNPIPDLPGDVAGDQSPVLDFSALFQGVNMPGTRIIPESFAKGGAKLFGADVAENLAGLQFDTPIRDIGIQQDRMKQTNEQNLADVGNWFGQVLKSQGAASARDAAINDAAVGSVRDAGAAILGAIGGEAAGGAGTVGAANAQAVGTLEALGANQEAYNEDLRPLLEAERAGAKSRERAMGTSRAQDLANRLVSLQEERGRAKAGLQFEIDKSNNSILDNRNTRAMEIRQANNGIAQQNFQNALGLINAQMGAAFTGAKIQSELAGPGGEEKFRKDGPSKHADAINAGLGALRNGPDGKPIPYPRAVQTIRNLLNGYGWSFRNPAVKTLALNIMREAGYSPDPRNFGPR